MLHDPRYGPGKRTRLIPDPTQGEGNGVEPPSPITGPEKNAAAPLPTPGKGDADDVLSQQTMCLCAGGRRRRGDPTSVYLPQNTDLFSSQNSESK